ncbi:hypothetical protein ACET3Z_005045 [Daucus carota]
MSKHKNICLISTQDDPWLWHRRLGYANMKLIKNISTNDHVRGIPNPNPNPNPKSITKPYTPPNQTPNLQEISPITYNKRNKYDTGPRSPKLLNLSNVGKLAKMMVACQPGMMVSLPQQGEVQNIINGCKWDNIIFYRGQNFHTYIMGEFYGNMITTKNQYGLFEINTMVQDTHIHVDVITVCKALKIDLDIFPQPCINIYDTFKFEKDEFEKFLKLFCGCELPIGLSVENCWISFKHLLPVYQQIAMIIRANVLPKPANDQYFDFADLKVMYQMVTNTVEFSIAYVIILHVFLAFQLDYMPYGLLLTAIFELYHISMLRVFAEKVEFCYVEKLVIPKVPLCEVKPYRFIPLGKTKEEATHDYIRENEILKHVIKDFQVKIDDNNTKIRGLEDDNIEINARLAEIETKLGASKAVDSENLNAKCGDLNQVITENELAEVGISVKPGDLPELNDFPPDLGYVAAVEAMLDE